MEQWKLLWGRKETQSLLYRLRRKGKLLVETIILYFLYAGIYQLYSLDTEIREEISGWKLGRVYGLECSQNGPVLYFMKKRNGICKIAPMSNRPADVKFQFKSADQAFQVVTGQISVANAYARHAFALSGDIGCAMSFARVVDRTEWYLFPKLITRRILKKQNRRQVSMLYVYIRIVLGMLFGDYRPEL